MGKNQNEATSIIICYDRVQVKSGIGVFIMDFTLAFTLEHLQSFNLLDVAPVVLINPKGLTLSTGETMFFVKKSKLEEVVFKTLHQAGFRELRFENIYQMELNHVMTPEEVYIVLAQDLQKRFVKLSKKRYAQVMVGQTTIWLVFEGYHCTITLA